MVYFDDGSKATVKVNPSDSTADLLDKVKDKVTSSAALLWIVDNEGRGMSCDGRGMSCDGCGMSCDGCGMGVVCDNVM